MATTIIINACRSSVITAANIRTSWINGNVSKLFVGEDGISIEQTLRVRAFEIANRGVYLLVVITVHQIPLNIQPSKLLKIGQFHGQSSEMIIIGMFNRGENEAKISMKTILVGNHVFHFPEYHLSADDLGRWQMEYSTEQSGISSL